MEYLLLEDLEREKMITLGRGNIISKIDINAIPGNYPIYSSSATGNGEFGRYGKYMFEDERVTWSIDGGGRPFYREKHKYSVTNVCGWLKINTDKLITKFVYYCLLFQWNMLKFDYTYKAHPSIIKEIYRIPMLPISIQKVIVEQLDKINNQISKNTNTLLYFEELTKSRFIEMFGHPVLSKKYNVVTIADMVKKGNALIKAGPFGSSLKKEYYVKSGYKIYGQEQVINDNPFLGDYYIDEQKYRSLISCKVEPGDVLISLVGTCGKTMIIPDNYEKGIINPRLLKIHFRNDYINPIYFKCFFADEELQKDLANKSGHSTMNVMNVSILKNVNVIVPPIELQDEFASFIEQVDKLKFTKKEQLLHCSL